MQQLNKYYVCIPFLLIGCTKQPETNVSSTTISVVIDVSDTFERKPSALHLFQEFDLYTSPDNACSYRVKIINDRSYSLCESGSLLSKIESDKNNVRDDPRYRKKEIGRFYHRFVTAIDSLPERARRQPLLPYSLCWQQIASELWELSKAPATKKLLVVYSDIRERSVVFDSYRLANERLLARSPNKVAKLFLNACPIPENLSGIEVRIVFSPVTREEDIAFSAMVQVYKKILESRGAQLVVTTN